MAVHMFVMFTVGHVFFMKFVFFFRSKRRFLGVKQKKSSDTKICKHIHDDGYDDDDSGQHSNNQKIIIPKPPNS